MTRVAIVDQHRLVAEGIAGLLERAGHTVTVMTDWHALLAATERYEVVVMEQHLGDGVLVGTRMRELAMRGSRAVVLGNRPGGSAARAALRAGANAFVPKTSAAQALVEAVARALTSEAIQSGDVPDHEPDVPNLGRQEERALVHYASGLSVREVAHAMSTTEETVKSYIKRGRRKFRDAGIDIGTRALLRRYAADSGWRHID